MDVCNLGACATAGETLVKRITADAGVNLKDCYQCGKCAAGCPVASHADMNCRKIIRNLQLGCVDVVLDSNMPWACLHCGTCLARCPQNVDMPSLNESICRIAVEEGRVASRDAKVFQDVFMGIINKNGLACESMLAGFYNIKTGHLFQDVASAPKMMGLGLLEAGLPNKVSNPDAIHAMVERAMNTQKGSDE